MSALGDLKALEKMLLPQQADIVVLTVLTKLQPIIAKLEQEQAALTKLKNEIYDWIEHDASIASNTGPFRYIASGIEAALSS